MERLTKTLVASLPPDADRDRYAYDNVVPGLAIKVTPGGRRTYVVRYRTGAGKSRKYPLGPTARYADPDAARAVARKVLAQVAAGADPATERRKEQAAVTVAQVAAMHLDECAKRKKKPATIKRYDGLWNKHIVPRLGRKAMVSLTLVDVRNMHSAVGAKRPVTANRALLCLSAGWNFAIESQLLPVGSNPCGHVTKFPEEQRDRILSDAELERVDAALDWYAARGRCQFYMAALVRLLFVTGCRLNELRLAKREAFDSEARVLRLGDHKAKGRTRKKGLDVVYFTDEAMAVLDSLPRVIGNPYLIPGGKGAGPVTAAWRRWKTICARAGIKDAVRLHDIRHTVGSLAHRDGLTQKQVANLLRHSQLSTTERYLHDDGRREAAAVASTGIGRRMRGKGAGNGSTRGVTTAAGQ